MVLAASLGPVSVPTDNSVGGHQMFMTNVHES